MPVSSPSNTANTSAIAAPKRELSSPKSEEKNSPKASASVVSGTFPATGSAEPEAELEANSFSYLDYINPFKIIGSLFVSSNVEETKTDEVENIESEEPNQLRHFDFLVEKINEMKDVNNTTRISQFAQLLTGDFPLGTKEVSQNIRSLISNKEPCCRGVVKLLVLLSEKMKALGCDEIFHPSTPTEFSKKFAKLDAKIKEQLEAPSIFKEMTNEIDENKFLLHLEHVLGLPKKTILRIKDNPSYYNGITCDRYKGLILLGNKNLGYFDMTSEYKYAAKEIKGIIPETPEIMNLIS